MSRRSRLHYTLTTIGYGASRMKARLPRSTCLLGDSLSFGAAVRYKLPSHTTSRQNQTPQPQSLGSVRAIAFRSWLPPIGPIKDSHLQSLRHARRNFCSVRCAPSTEAAHCEICYPIRTFITVDQLLGAFQCRRSPGLLQCSLPPTRQASVPSLGNDRRSVPVLLAHDSRRSH